MFSIWCRVLQKARPQPILVPVPFFSNESALLDEVTKFSHTESMVVLFADELSEKEAQHAMLHDLRSDYDTKSMVVFAMLHTVRTDYGKFSDMSRHEIYQHLQMGYTPEKVRAFGALPYDMLRCGVKAPAFRDMGVAAADFGHCIARALLDAGLLERVLQLPHLRV